MTKFLIIETIFADEQKKYYTFELPVGSSYRQVTSFNAFFYSRSHPRNWTNKRLFIARSPDELLSHEKLAATSATKLTDIYEFFNMIGYDYKSKTYLSGERARVC